MEQKLKKFNWTKAVDDLQKLSEGKMKLSKLLEKHFALFMFEVGYFPHYHLLQSLEVKMAALHIVFNRGDLDLNIDELLKQLPQNLNGLNVKEVVVSLDTTKVSSPLDDTQDSLSKKRTTGQSFAVEERWNLYKYLQWMQILNHEEEIMIEQLPSMRVSN